MCVRLFFGIKKSGRASMKRRRLFLERIYSQIERSTIGASHIDFSEFILELIAFLFRFWSSCAE